MDQTGDKDHPEQSRGDEFIRLKILEGIGLSQNKSEFSAHVINCDKPSDDYRIGTNEEIQPEQSVVLRLEGTWSNLFIDEPSIVHLIEPLYDPDSRTYTVNNATGLVIINTEDLITCTAISSSLYCERKSWLDQVFPQRVASNQAKIIGLIVHDVFLRAIKENETNRVQLSKWLEELLCRQNIMLDIYSTGLHMSYFRKELDQYLDNISLWISKYTQSGSKHSLANNDQYGFRLSKVYDIENMIQSPRLGLKGKIDLTGSVRIYDRELKKFNDLDTALEVKTGSSKLSLSHEAQINLYTMMVENDGIQPNCGYVTYLKDNAKVYESQVSHNARRDLIQRRNMLSLRFKNHKNGPPMLDRLAACRSCDRLTECLTMFTLYENDGLENYQTMASLHFRAAGHLDCNMLQFFRKHHERLLTIKESNEASKSCSNMEDFELVGRGFRKLQLTDSERHRQDLLSFRRHPKYIENYQTNNKLKSPSSQDGSRGKSAKMLRLKAFDRNSDLHHCRVAISLDTATNQADHQGHKPPRVTLTMGLVHELRDSTLTVKLFGRQQQQWQKHSITPDDVYRIDRVYPERDTTFNTMKLVLSRLLTNSDLRVARVRRLILNPEFKSTLDVDMIAMVRSLDSLELASLEPSSLRTAIIEAISCNNYFLFEAKHLSSCSEAHKIVSVMTGIICKLYRTVLIVAQSIDALMELMRLLNLARIRFILIDDGRSTKARHQFAGNLVKVPQGSERMDLISRYDNYIRQYEKAPVVITTYAMSISGLMFTQRTFDYCIAYDCDNTELLVGLSPMFCTDRHILFESAAPQHESLEQASSSVSMLVDPLSCGGGDECCSLSAHLKQLWESINSNETSSSTA